MMKWKKVETFILSSFRRRPESSRFNDSWIPGQARYDEPETYYESIKDGFLCERCVSAVKK